MRLLAFRVLVLWLVADEGWDGDESHLRQPNQGREDRSSVLVRIVHGTQCNHGMAILDDFRVSACSTGS